MIRAKGRRRNGLFCVSGSEPGQGVLNLRFASAVTLLSWVRIRLESRASSLLHRSCRRRSSEGGGEH